jgi:hypothetical protein
MKLVSKNRIKKSQESKQASKQAATQDDRLISNKAAEDVVNFS